MEESDKKLCSKTEERRQTKNGKFLRLKFVRCALKRVWKKNVAVEQVDICIHESRAGEGGSNKKSTKSCSMSDTHPNSLVTVTPELIKICKPTKSDTTAESRHSHGRQAIL